MTQLKFYWVNLSMLSLPFWEKQNERFIIYVFMINVSVSFNIILVKTSSLILKISFDSTCVVVSASKACVNVFI